MIGRPRWRWLAWVSGGFLLLGLAVAGVGALLPADHRASASVTLPSAPDSVWAVVRNLGGYPAWWPWMRSITRVPGAPGEAWRQESRHGDVMTVDVTEPAPRTMVTTILDEDLPFGGTWTYAVAADSGGARVTVTEDGVIHNPLFRFMARFVFGYDGTLKDYLAALEARVAS